MVHTVQSLCLSNYNTNRYKIKLENSQNNLEKRHNIEIRADFYLKQGKIWLSRLAQPKNTIIVRQNISQVPSGDR